MLLAEKYLKIHYDLCAVFLLGTQQQVTAAAAL